MPNITKTQFSVLQHAAQRDDRLLAWFPENVKGIARIKVTQSLFEKGFIINKGPENFISEDGYKAIGMEVPNVSINDLHSINNSECRENKKSWPTGKKDKSTPEKISKQSIVIELLKRPGGATVKQIMEETGWQAHTLQGMFSGVLRKKMGFIVDSEKVEGGDRVYRILAASKN